MTTGSPVDLRMIRSPLLIWSARLALATAVAAIGWVALIPVGQVPVTTWWDKADHAVGFFVLALLARFAFPRARYSHRLAPALLAYGVAIELAQSFTLTRSASLLDVVADLVGLLLFGLAVRITRSAQRARGHRAP